MAEPSKMFARIATPADREAFLALARLYVEEGSSEATFDEGAARYTFDGLARADPGIHLLLDGDEVIGFMLLRDKRMPFTKGRVWQQEETFVRADKRTAEAEGRLFDLMLEMIGLVNPSEARLMVQPSDHDTHVYDGLRLLGCQPAGAALSFVGVVDFSKLFHERQHVQPEHPTLN